MFYLDTSAAAQSPASHGVPRVTRRLYEALRQFGPVAPLVWSRRHHTFCPLSTSEWRFLEQPFAQHSGPLLNPRAMRRRPRYAFERWLHQRRTALPFDQLCQPGNTLLMPDPCDDDRVAWIQRAANDGRLRMMAIFHDAIPYLRPDLTPWFRLTGYEDYLRCLSRFHTVVSCSEESRDALIGIWRRLGCAPAPVIVEPWPTDLGPRGQSDPMRFDRPRVLYVSSLDPRKNHLMLFAACERLWSEGSHFELELIGRQLPDSSVSKPVIEAIRRLQRGGRPVQWQGHVSDDALVAAYQQCSFTVYPSLIEGFGLPIHESLWFGRPCVCGTNGALGEVSAGGGCLACDQTQVDSLADAMRRLLTDRALYMKLSEEAAQRPFRSWEDYGRALQRHLEE